MIENNDVLYRKKGEEAFIIKRNYGDPLVFVQATARQLGISVKENNTRRHTNITHPKPKDNILFNYKFPTRKNGETYFDASCNILYLNKFNEVNYRFNQYIEGKVKLGDISFNKFDMAKHTMDKFELYRDYLGVSFSAERIMRDSHKTGEFNNNLLLTAVREKGRYQLHTNLWKKNRNEMKSLLDWYKDVEEVSEEDYRPYFRRTLEIIAKLPQDKWHDPKMYKVDIPVGMEVALKKSMSDLELSVRSRKCLQRHGVGNVGELIQMSEFDLLETKNFGITSLYEIKRQLNIYGLHLGMNLDRIKDFSYQNEEIDESFEKIVAPSIEMLFAGDERKELQQKIEQARLRLGDTWSSVPRLSLGAIRLPNPVQNDISQDEFVREAAPYLIEYLGAMGIMTPEESEKVVGQKLINYFVHQAGFQLNKDRASNIVDNLRKGSKDIKELEIA